MSKVIQFKNGNNNARDYLHGLDDNVVACKGGHHDWPHIKPGNLPSGVKAIPHADGCYQVQETCRSCGLVRIKTTLPEGYYDNSAKYQYLDRVGYYAPPGSNLSKYDYAAELYRRLAETLRQAERKVS